MSKKKADPRKAMARARSYGAMHGESWARLLYNRISRAQEQYGCTATRLIGSLAVRQLRDWKGDGKNGPAKLYFAVAAEEAFSSMWMADPAFVDLDTGNPLQTDRQMKKASSVFYDAFISKALKELHSLLS